MLTNAELYLLLLKEEAVDLAQSDKITLPTARDRLARREGHISWDSMIHGLNTKVVVHHAPDSLDGWTYRCHGIA